jgi:ubiquinone/menaquinone biosynthesis C-methylase UbiE
MPTNVCSNRWAQFVSWFVVSLFILGFFFSSIANWTGPILGVWFVGTQKIRRGFLWMLAFAFIPALLMGWRSFPLTGPAPALKYLVWMLLAAVLGVLPFTFHRLTSARLPGLLSTLPLPAAAAINHVLLQPPLHIGSAPGTGVHTFFVFWFAAVVVWMWNHEFKRSKVAVGAGIFAVVSVVALGLEFFRSSTAVSQLPASAFAWTCVAAEVALTVWAVLHPGKQSSWADKPEAAALLQSPSTGSPLRVVVENGQQSLASSSGERFPIHNGIPNFLGPNDLTGDNGKYNHLYETIGGFYDDTQRVACALKGLNRDEYFLAYMRKLEVKPGDAVLETSVGTGLNLRYLPLGVRLFGLDLSSEMLASCQTNLCRWGLDADLVLGNAESLPFADSSFDVVFHVGGISFFNDQAKAIREMIRVAKPGTLILISDETEEYAQKTYERIPITSSYYKNRKQPVKVPIDLVPAEMEEVNLEMIKGDMFYAITFRKPALALAAVRHRMEA